MERMPLRWCGALETYIAEIFVGHQLPSDIGSFLIWIFDDRGHESNQVLVNVQ